MSRTSTEFGLTVSAREDGTLEAAYVQLSKNQVARTEELIESVLLLDLDSRGAIVGIEILAPVSISVVMNLAKRLEEPQRKSFKKFLKASAPPALVHA
jgi:uncharacterized protein YuzE